MSAAVFTIRPAQATENGKLRELLEEAHLPTQGVEDPQTRLWIAGRGGEIAAMAGLERFGEVALLRSVATQAPFRGQGAATALCRTMLAEAAAQGVGRVYLLTETAEGFFRRLGFEAVPRDSLDPRLSASAELRGNVCASATAMARALP
jgi:amino-acid N-acetyltransferase